MYNSEITAITYYTFDFLFCVTEILRRGVLYYLQYNLLSYKYAGRYVFLVCY